MAAVAPAQSSQVAVRDPEVSAKAFADVISYTGDRQLESRFKELHTIALTRVMGFRCDCRTAELVKFLFGSLAQASPTPLLPQDVTVFPGPQVRRIYDHSAPHDFSRAMSKSQTNRTAIYDVLSLCAKTLKRLVIREMIESPSDHRAVATILRKATWLSDVSLKIFVLGPDSYSFPTTLKHLEILGDEQSEMTADTMEAIADRCPYLESLALHKLRITDPYARGPTDKNRLFVRALAKMKNLQELNLSSVAGISYKIFETVRFPAPFSRLGFDSMDLCGFQTLNAIKAICQRNLLSNLRVLRVYGTAFDCQERDFDTLLQGNRNLEVNKAGTTFQSTITYLVPGDSAAFAADMMQPQGSVSACTIL